MSAILMRTLTKKSKLNFGKYKDCTVEQLIGMRKQKDLISAYFKLSTINFNDEVLNEIGITEEYRIEKPNTDKEKYFEFINRFYEKPMKQHEALTNMRRKPKLLTRAQMQNINQLS
jgi:hypothetical protein